jgi:hypothetical protein
VDALQYEITLPADYDMGIIRHRVATRGHALDDRAGLGLKAYLTRERGAQGSPVNEYAPFYLWNDTAAAAHFLVGGGGFQGIVADFGRPVVRHWTGLAHEPGPAAAARPRSASRRRTPVPVLTDPDGLAAFVAAEVAALARHARRDGVHSAALGLDPAAWELVRFTLWEPAAVPGDGEDADAERYAVLHLSAPGLAALPAGRRW